MNQRVMTASRMPHGCHSGAVLRLRPPSDDVLRRVLEDQRDRPFNYPEVGATAGTTLPWGFITTG